MAHSEQHICKLLRTSAGLFLAGVWSICLFRSIAFILEGNRVYAESGSVNARNDCVYGRLILFSYLVCAGIGWGAWRIVGRRERGGIGWIPILASVACGFYVLLRKPEEVITLFPDLTPWYALRTCVSSAVVAIAVFAWFRLRQGENVHA